MEASRGNSGYTRVFARVFHKELTYVQERRKAVGLNADSIAQEQHRLCDALGKLGDQDPDTNPKLDKDIGRVGVRVSADAGLVGLALSGGGIRSATFNLGLLQALAEQGILRYCDYLSTVSGGGYIGSCLSSLLDNSDASVEADKFPFRIQQGEDPDEDPDERKEMKWLREHGNYLAPDTSLFSLDIWRMIGLYLSGLALTNTAPLAFICVLAYAIHWISTNTNTYALAKGLLFLSLIAFAVMIAARWLAAFRNLDMDARRQRATFQAWLAALVASLASVAGLILLAIFFPRFRSEADNLLHVMPFASAIGLVAGLVKSESPRLQGLSQLIFRIAWIPLLPLLFAWLLRSFTENAALTQPLFGIPVVLLMGVGLLLVSIFTDTNRISLHHFYRDCLSKAYVIKRVRKKDSPNEEIVSNETLTLAELHAHPNGAPYQLINVTLNVPGTHDRYLRGREADFFIFSKLYCGAESTGYRRTDKYDNGETRLATALAISGAAASPQMGTATSPTLRFLLTLLNVRLNRWMLNPDPQRDPLLEFWPYYFVKELLGKEKETDGLLNLSDGGHHENLGVYPLIKRRCRYIIASDAGADPGFAMEDLANLLRKVRIDLGVDINIDLSGLQQNLETKNTSQHYAVGKIRYPSSEEGVLIYIKASLTGRESEDLLTYRRQNPDFPDQTTADQFFDEPQFESYRKLGDLSGREVFSQAEVLSKLQSRPLGRDFAHELFCMVQKRYEECLLQEARVQ